MKNDVLARLPDLPLTINTDAASADTALTAQTDADAVSAWLAARGGRSPNTFASYRREAARLLLWLEERRLGLRDLKVEHVHEFYALLVNPPAHWLRPHKPKRGEDLMPTQVLVKALDAGSINYARRVLGQLCDYLRDAGYLRRNAFRLSAQLPVVDKSVSARILDVESWQWLWGWVTRMPRDTKRMDAHAARARWVLSLLYHTGTRREEIATGRMGDFVRTDGQWSLRVIGKGRKVRDISVNSVLLQELLLYRSALHTEHKFPIPGELLPLVVSLNGARADVCLTARAVGMIVADISDAAAKQCPDEHIESKLLKMSTHWVRHTNATHRHLAGAGETTQDALGHTDPKTTQIYAKIADKARHQDAEKLAQFSIENQTSDADYDTK